MRLCVLAAEARHPFVDRLRALAHGLELAAVLGGELGVGPADALGEVGAGRYLVRQAVEHDQPLLVVVEHDAGGQRLDGLAQQVAPVGIGHAQHQQGRDQAGADERHDAADDLQQGIAAAARHRCDLRRRLDVVALGQAVEVGADRHDLAHRRLVERIGAAPHRDLRRHAMHDLVAAMAQPVEQGAVGACRVEAAAGAVERRGEAVPGLERRRLVVGALAITRPSSRPLATRVRISAASDRRSTRAFSRVRAAIRIRPQASRPAMQAAPRAPSPRATLQSRSRTASAACRRSLPPANRRRAAAARSD